MKLNNFAKITKRALSLNKVLYFLMVFIVVFGAFTFNNMTKSLMPKMEIPYVTIVTTMTGASADDMEEMVTEVIEDELNDISGVEEITSSSSKSVSSIILKFKENSDINIAIRDVERKVKNIENLLPSEANKPIVSDIDINKFPTLLINLSAEMPYYNQMDIIDEIKYRLGKVEGIKSVEISGLEKPRVNIIPDIKLMQKFNITNSMLVNIVKDNGMDIPVGEKNVNSMTYSFETDNKIKSIEALREIIILNYNDRIIRLADIAEVEYQDKSAALNNYTVVGKDRKPVVSLEIYLKEDADSIKVNDQCQKIVDNWNRENPTNKLVVSLDTSIFIRKSIRDISTNAFSGILSVIVVLFLFINLGEAIIASFIIPITLISSIILFKPFGLTVNMLSIIGLIIALGMLVDNAIVVIEMIDENKLKFANKDFKEVILLSINKVGAAIFSSTITTICAFIPLAFLDGPIGAMIRSIPIAMAISISLSFIVSITLTPVLAYSFLSRKEEREDSLILKLFYMLIVVVCGLYAFSNDFKLTQLSYISGFIVLVCSAIKLFKKPSSYSYTKIFDKIIHSVMKSKVMQVLVFVFTISLFVYALSLLAGDKIPKENFPEYDEPMLLITLKLIEGTSSDDSEEIFIKAEEVLGDKDYIKLHTVIMDETRQLYYIELKDNKKISNMQIIKELSYELNRISDVNATVATNNISVAPILIRLSGNDYDELISESKVIVDILKGISGVVNPKADYEYGNATAKIIIDKEKAAENNIIISDLAMQLRYIISGQKISNIEVDGKNVYTYVKYDDVINDIRDIKSLSVLNTNNKLVPIHDFVKIEEYRNIKTLNHIDGKRILEIKAFNDENTTVDKIVKQFEKKLKESGGLKLGTKYSIAGEYDEMAKSYRDLSIKFIVALVLVYVVLLIQFNSFFQPLVIILCVPFSIIGVSLGYFFTGLTFSTLTFLGIISLVGIAINDAIVLMDFINQLRRDGMDRLESIIAGAKSRLKPIITTSLTTITGVMPLAIYNPDYSQMAYALVFGLISSTVLTLVVIPTVLNLVESFGALFKRKDYRIEK